RPGEPLAALAPGAGSARRRWPPEKYAAMAGWLASERAARVLVIGGPGEEPLAGPILAQAPGAPSPAGAPRPRQTLPLLRRCQLFVGNDAGPAHLAAAAGAPVVVLCCHPEGGAADHYNSPSRFRPWGTAVRVVQPVAVPPCTSSCESDGAHC